MGRILLPLLLSLTLLGCLATTKESSAKSESPSWLNGNHPRYPKEMYLTGVGQSRNIERAGDKARADLAKTFKVEIDSTSFQRTTSDSRTTSRGTDEVVRRSARQDITASTQAELKSVEVVATWHDKKARQFYAFAALDRHQAAEDFKADLVQLDEAVAHLTTRAGQRSDKLDRVADLRKAVEKSQQREAVLAYLNVVEPGSRKSHPAIQSLDQLEDSLINARQTISFGVVAVGSEADRLTEYGQRGLANLGYVSESDRGADYTLRLEMSVREPIQRDGLYWLIGDLEIQLLSVTDGQVQGGCQWSIKKAARDLPLARQKVLQQLQNEFGTKLGETIDRFIDGQHCR